MKQKNFFQIFAILLASTLVLSACQSTSSPKQISSMKLSSPSFNNNSTIPAKFTCQGKNINPQLDLTDVPTEAKSLALIVDDPDAPSGDFVHWVVWNIPTDTKSIPENAMNFAIQGSNGAGKGQYAGPCPPTGIHRYFFRLYALDQMLDIPTTSTKADLLKAIEGKILEENQLMGTYRKS